MGFEDPSVVDAAEALGRFRELRGEFREEPKRTQLLAAYHAIRPLANSVTKNSRQALEASMQTAGLGEDERLLLRLVDGQGADSPGALVAHAGVAPPSEILEGFLYLGGDEQARDTGTLHSLGIKHILNMTDDLDNHSRALQEEWNLHQPGTECSYCNCPALDVNGYDIDQHLDTAMEFIDGCRAAGGSVLVHCRMGVNRSGSAVIAYVMQHSGLDFSGALQRVRQRRPGVLTNGSFAVQLMARSGMELSAAAREILATNDFNMHM